jgi:integrase
MNVAEYEKYISDEERLQILEFAEKQSPSLRLCVHILDKLGLRVGEAVKIRVNDIDFKNNILRVYAPKQKKVINRIIPNNLMEILKTHIARYAELIKRSDNYICFVYGHGSKNLHIQTNTLNWFFQDFRKTYGYTDPYMIGRDGNPRYRHSSHTFRSRWITEFIKKGSKLGMGAEVLRLVQQEIGHKKIKTTARYVRFFDREDRTKKVVVEMFQNEN